MSQAQHKLLSFITKNLTFLILGTALVCIYLSFFVFEAQVKINIQTNSPLNTYFKIYWADKEQTYSERRMARVLVNNQQQAYQLSIADLGDIERLRIDPVEYPAKVLIREISISQFGFMPIILSGKQALGILSAVQQAEAVAYKKPDGVVFQTTGNDGQLEIKINPVRQLAFPARHIATLLALFCILALITVYLRPLLTDLRFVPYLLAVAFLLALIMALRSETPIHPDEAVHVSAINYYAHHLLPPALDSELAAPTYSIYGHSRLSNYEIFYQLAGYFQRVVKSGNEPTLFTARLFNLGLFSLLLLISIVNKDFRPFALPFLVSAQIWYLFAYTNSDAFGLVIATIMSYQVAYQNSMLNQFLTQTNPKYFWLKLLGLGLLFGMLLLSKINYYFFVVFLGLYLIWRISQEHFPVKKRLWSRLGLILVIATSLYGTRFALDISANGWDRADMAAQMQEKFAKLPYKASTTLDQKGPMLNLKERGESLGKIVITDRWFEKTFQSAFGVFGFNQFSASLAFFDFVRFTGILLILVLLLGSLNGKRYNHLALLAFVGVCALGLILSSIWYSWSAAFQAQGRYMLPIFPMLTIYYYHVRQFTVPHVIEWLSIALFGLALYSFWFIGLPNVDKLHSILG